MTPFTRTLLLGVAFAATTALGCEGAVAPRPATKSPLARTVACEQDPSRCDAACGRGDAASCDALGVLYSRGKSVEQSDYGAASYHWHACNLGYVYGCTKLAHLYRAGRGVEPDLAKAQALYTQGCDGGDARACIELAGMYAGGKGVPKDEGRAVTFYERACEGGDYEACKASERLKSTHP